MRSIGRKQVIRTIRFLTTMSVELRGVLQLLAVKRSERVLVLGDSHCRSFASPGVFVRHLGPITLYRAGRPGEATRLYHAALRTRTPILGRVVRFALRDARSIVAVSFGEIDCRCHVGQRLSPNGAADDVIRALGQAALSLAFELGDASGRRIAFLEITPASELDLNPDFPVVGTLEERISWTRQLNHAVACRLEDEAGGVAFFVETASHFMAPDGRLSYCLSDGNVHIAGRWGRFLADSIRLAALSTRTEQVD